MCIRLCDACKSLIRVKGCDYKNKIDRESADKVKLPWEPIEIEEIHKIAEQHTFCPYFATKDRVNAADVIFMPY